MEQPSETQGKDCLLYTAKQLMEYAGWQEGRKVDISIAEKYYACLLYTSRCV